MIQINKRTAMPEPVPQDNPVVRRRAGRPSRAGQAQKQEHLLQCALQAFLKNGFEGASIHAIAQVSGISRDTFYRQYGSKEELFRAATHHGLEKLTAPLSLALATAGTVEEVLTRAAMQINRDLVSDEAVPILRLIMSEAPRFPELTNRMLADSHITLAPLTEYLTAQQAAGNLEMEDPFTAAFMLSTLAFGGVSIFFEPSNRSDEERQRWVSKVVQTLLKGWQPRNK